MSKSCQFENTNDKQLAQALKAKYLEEHTITSTSDMNTLDSLVYYEVWQIKMQKDISHIMSTKEKNDKLRVPKERFEIIERHTKLIMQLKLELGLSKKDTDNSVVNYIETLKKKAKVWMKENSAQRTRQCPHCQKMINFTVKMDHYNANPHKFHKGRWICNEHLIKMYKEGKITNIDIGKILGTSAKYTEFLINKFFKVPVINDEETED